MNKSFRGQWEGFTAKNSPVLVNMGLNVKNINGTVSLFEHAIIDNKKIYYYLWYHLEGKATNKEKIKGKLYNPVLYDYNGNIIADDEYDEFKEKAGIEFPDSTAFNAVLKNNNELRIISISKYQTAPDQKNAFELKKKDLSTSIIPARDMRWSDFKNYALKQNDELIYRGQPKQWPLQTAYHRTGYADLVQYLDFEIPQLEHYINSISTHPYNHKDNHSLGSLLNLAQHHGYPTPLLDWSRSPYVAAFFAFENESKLKEGEKISIFVFNDIKWAEMAGRTADLRTPRSVVRTMELPGFGNSRALPQQSITMFSNVDDIESIIKTNEDLEKETYLEHIIIPVSDAEEAMRDLSLMGITWGSMFPDFDGVCKQLKFRHFKK
jgi:hypothetical protein